MPMNVFQTILVIIFWLFTLFQYRFDSLQVKQDLISSIIEFIYEFSQELPSNLRLRAQDLQNWEVSNLS